MGVSVQGCFLWPRNKDIIQGPAKKYPAVTYEEFLAVKGKGFGYVLSHDTRVYEDAQKSRIVLGMPLVLEKVAA